MTKKEQILKTALQLFIEHGFDNTPTSLISQEAGVATGTLFHHFKTKEELINALYLEIKLQVMETIVTAAESRKGIQERMQTTWFYFIDWVLVHEAEFRFMVQFGESSLISTQTRERAEEAFQGSKGFLEKGLREGVFYPLPLDLLLALLTSHLFASCHYFLEHPQQWQDAAFREVVFASCWSLMAKDG